MTNRGSALLITTLEFAVLAGISRRAAIAALKRALGGRPWRGYVLSVQPVRSRGGDAGRGLQIDVYSLPPALVLKYQQAQQSMVPVGAPRFIGAADPKEPIWQKRLAMLQAAIAAYEEERPVLPALRAAAQRHGVSVETARIWWKRYQKHGVAGLQRKQPSHKGQRSVFISKIWDAATASLSDEVRRQIAADLEKHVRSLYAAGAPSRRQVAQLATVHLVELTRAAGIELSDSEAPRICRVPPHFARRGRHCQLVAIKKHDAKRFFDRYTPRVKRDRSSLLPMEFVAGDVHHIDILYRRDDGSTATPKLITWADLATNRLFGSVVFLSKGKGVTQEQVISSFIEMTQAWGMPVRLYLDNGSEYQWTEFVGDALKCAAFTGRDIKIEDGGVTRARPYNAPAKVIESFFSSLERGPFAMLPGYIGGDRMASKVANVGNAPVPFAGSADELRRVLLNAIEYHNITPLEGTHLKGRSPRQAYEEQIAAGWMMTAIDRHVLQAVFAEDVHPRVDRGHVRVRGVDYYADRLLDFSGQRVHVRVPKSGDRSKLLVLDEGGNLLCFAEEVIPYDFHDRQGAREQGRRSRLMNEAVAARRAATTPVDLAAEMQRVVALQPPARVAPIGARITVSDNIEEQAAAISTFPTPEKRKQQKTDARRRRGDALVALSKRLAAKAK